MEVAIAKKGALSRPELKFVSIVGAQVGITCTPKNLKRAIVGFLMKQFFEGCSIAKDFSG